MRYFSLVDYVEDVAGNNAEAFQEVGHFLVTLFLVVDLEVLLREVFPSSGHSILLRILVVTELHSDSDFVVFVTGSSLNRMISTCKVELKSALFSMNLSLKRNVSAE